MTTYTSRAGIVYLVKPGWAHGDIIILSSDEDAAAWKVDGKTLQNASPVFRDMLANPLPGPQEIIIPDAPYRTIDNFLWPIFAEVTPNMSLDFGIMHASIDLLIKFECLDTARRLLSGCSREFEEHEILDAFVFASQLGDVFEGARILLEGHRWYAYYSEYEPDEVSPSLYPFCTIRPWTKTEATRLRPEWAWALTMAAAEVKAQPPKPLPKTILGSDPKFWSAIAGGFLRYVMT